MFLQKGVYQNGHLLYENGYFPDKFRMPPIIQIGMIGCGTVGREVARLLLEGENSTLRGHRIVIKKIAVRDLKKDRGLKSPPLTLNPQEIIEDPEISVVIELMGGLDPAYQLVKGALERGKHVITANKALIAKYGDELFHLASSKKVHLGIEGSVAGSIPILQLLQYGLKSNKIRYLAAILNGTCNYILTQMELKGVSFQEALQLAQREGFSEADPRLDLSGEDTQQKLSILMRCATGVDVDVKKIPFEGIEKISLADIQFAKEYHYAIKLLAISRKDGEKYQLRVHPALISKTALLSHVLYENNGIYLVGDIAGPQLYFGKGAGGVPTASSILSDLIAIVDKRPIPATSDRSLEISSIEKLVSPHYLRMVVADETGVLAKITKAFGEMGVSIAILKQEPIRDQNRAQIMIITHPAIEKSVDEAVKQIEDSGYVSEPITRIRIEDLEPTR